MGSPSVLTVSEKSYSLLDVTMFISPEAGCYGGRWSHVVALYVVLITGCSHVHKP